MDFLTSVASAVTSLKTAKELVDSFRQPGSDSKSEQERLRLLSILNDVSGQLFDLKTQGHALNDQARELERELATLRSWRNEQANYTLSKLPSGTHVYSHKHDNQLQQPDLYICPHCYEKESKSILQPHDNTSSPVFTTLRCPNCKTVYRNELVKTAVGVAGASSNAFSSRFGRGRGY